ALRPWVTRLTARRNSLSARERDEVFERRSILPGAAAGSPASVGRAETAFAAPTGAFEPDRGALELRCGIGVVNSVASRSMSTFTLSGRCGGGVCAPAEPDAEIDAAGGVGAGCEAADWGAVADRDRD